MNPNSSHTGGFKKPYSHSSSTRPFRRGRPHFKKGGPHGGHGGKPRFGGKAHFGGKRGFSAQKIDISRYINKNVAAPVPAAPFVPKHAFADFAVESKLKTSIASRGYVSPTPIQDASIPVILKGSDIVGIANTGTGKTAAFLIPLIHKVLLDKKAQVLIMAPTRELAQQINDELRAFAPHMGIFSACLVGGAPIERQIRHLRYHNQFVIGTPGRVKDLMERGNLNLSNFKTVVLDEADRMLDMGFIADMKLVMSKMAAERQTLFFSATLSPEIEKLIHAFLKNPVRVSVKTQDVSKNIEQDVIHVKHGEHKVDILHGLLSGDGFDKVLVFGRTKHGVQRLSDALVARGVSSVAIHGNKNQSQRQRALDDFKKNRSKVMVATDVAARGLDIPDVSHVINYDLPATHEDYIHRIGRTGRGSKLGKALTFIE